MPSPHDLHQSIAFIDVSLPDLPTLQAGLPHGIEQHLLPAGRDGLAHIAHTLAGRNGLEALHLITHGAPGQLMLGSHTLSCATLRADTEALNAITNAMAEDGEWLIYGCEVATGHDGHQFIDALRECTGLRIAAASHKVGTVELGGSWELDVGVPLVNTLKVANWGHILSSTIVIGGITEDDNGSFDPGTSIYLDGSLDYAFISATNSGNLNTGFLSIIYSAGTENGTFRFDPDFFDAENNKATGSVAILAGNSDGSTLKTNGSFAAGDSIFWINNSGDKTLLGVVDTTANGQAGSALKINFTTNNATTGDANSSAAGYVLQFLQFTSPTSGARTFSITASDGTDTSEPVTVTLTGNDIALPVVDLNGVANGINNTATYTHAGPAVAFTSGITNLVDTDSTELTSLSITIDSTTIQTGDKLVLGSTSIAIDSSTDSGTVADGDTSFHYAINNADGFRTVTFTSQGGNDIDMPAAIAKFETLLDTLKFDTSSTSTDTRIFHIKTKDVNNNTTETAAIFSISSVANTPPIITSTPVTDATEGSHYNYTLIATDTNSGDTLTWTLKEGSTLPTGVTLGQGQSTATFADNFADPGGMAYNEATGDIYASTNSLIAPMVATESEQPAIYKIAPDGTSTLFTLEDIGQVGSMVIHDGYLYAGYIGLGGINGINRYNLSDTDGSVVAEPVLEFGSNPGGVVGLATKGGFLYAVNISAAKILKIDLSNLSATPEVYLDLAAHNKESPYGIAFDNAGNLYGTLLGSSGDENATPPIPSTPGEIFKYDGTTFSIVMSDADGDVLHGKPLDIKIDTEGNFYVSHSLMGGSSGIYKYDSSFHEVAEVSATANTWSMIINNAGVIVAGDVQLDMENGVVSGEIFKLDTTHYSLSGTPDDNAAGDYPITLVASDGVNIGVEQTFILHVADVPQDDTTAPTLTSSSPTDDATGVSISNNLTLTFSEALANNFGVIELHKSSDGSLVESFTLSSSNVAGAVVTLNPTADLDYSTGYYLTTGAVSQSLPGIGHTPPSSTGIQDLAGNAYEGISDATTLNFTTAAPDAPGGGGSGGGSGGSSGGDDQDGIDATVEDSVPGLPPTNGGPAVAGDGNGDGIKDSDQPAVTSLTFLRTDTSVSNPGAAPKVFVTLVADAKDGKVNAGSKAVITSISQKDAPANLPEGAKLPLGLFDFTAKTAAPGSTENFSIFIDGDITINGYWKEVHSGPSAGTWVNLADAAYGGKIVTEQGKTRLDFSIQDGGIFDDDGKADGTISDPGGPGFMATATPTCPFDPFRVDADKDGMTDAIELLRGSSSAIKNNDVFSHNDLFVDQLYRDFLGREGYGDAGSAYWLNTMGTGVMNRTDVLTSVLSSPEFDSHAGAVIRLYHAALGRSPELCGYNYWLGKANAGMNTSEMGQAFLDSSEFATQQAGLDNAGFVDLMYHNVLQRAPEAAGRAYWIDQLQTGKTDRGGMLYSVVQSQEFKAAMVDDVAVDILYLGLLDRTASSAETAYWMSQYSQYADPTAFLQAASAATTEYHDRFIPNDGSSHTAALVGVLDELAAG